MNRWSADNMKKAFGKYYDDTVKAPMPSCQDDQLKIAEPAFGLEFEYQGPGGGWRDLAGEDVPPPEPPMCHFDVRHDLTPEQFLSEYVAIRRPVLLRCVARPTALTDHFVLFLILLPVSFRPLRTFFYSAAGLVSCTLR